MSNRFSTSDSFSSAPYGHAALDQLGSSPYSACAESSRLILLGKGKSLLAGSKRAARPCRRRSREHPLHKLALKDTLTTPVGGGFRSVNVWLRESFGAYANVRPAKRSFGAGHEDIDIVLIRTSKASMSPSSTSSQSATIVRRLPARTT